MKKLILTLCMLLFAITVSQADIVYVTDVRAEADLVVYITNVRANADMVIKITDSNLDARAHESHWYFTEYKSEADIKIYYSSIMVGATKVYFTNVLSYSYIINNNLDLCNSPPNFDRKLDVLMKFTA